MLKVILSPISSTHDTTVSVDGLTVTVDGTPYDLAVIPEGGQAEAEEGGPFIGIVTREEVTVLYHYDGSTAEPDQSTDWADYSYFIESGPVPDPIVRKEVSADGGV